MQLPPFATPGIGQRIASPELNSGGRSPEANTVLASPLADKLGGGLQMANGKLAMLVNMVRKGLQQIALLLRDSDPKTASDVEQMAAKLLKLGALANVTPQTVAAMAQSQQVRPGMGQMSPMPPPAQGGAPTGPLGGLLGGSGPGAGPGTMMGR